MVVINGEEPASRLSRGICESQLSAEDRSTEGAYDESSEIDCGGVQEEGHG